MAFFHQTILNIFRHPANSDQKLAALIRYFRWQYMKRTGRKLLPFEFHGFTLPGYLDSHSASAAYYFHGWSDYREMMFMKHYLREGDHFLDVGANIGLYTLLAASIVGPAGRIDALEPNPGTRRRLDETIQINELDHCVTVHEIAASDNRGTIEFGFSNDDCQSRVRAPSDASSSGVTVPTDRLDSIFSNRAFALLKMDIEGSEPLALAGATGMLSHSNPPAMIVEMAGYSRKFGVSTSQLINQLAEYDYDCGVYDPVTRQVMFTNKPWELGVENVVAISRSRKEWVESRVQHSLA